MFLGQTSLENQSKTDPSTHSEAEGASALQPGHRSHPQYPAVGGHYGLLRGSGGLTLVRLGACGRAASTERAAAQPDINWGYWKMVTSKEPRLPHNSSLLQENKQIGAVEKELYL